MSVLIISLPRTGSSELGKRLSIAYNLKYECEPFNFGNKWIDCAYPSNIVLKTIIFHTPNYVTEPNRISWLIELSKNFNEIILLSRRNLVQCAESWAFLNYKEKEKNFKNDEFYLWEKTPNYDEEFKFIQKCNSELEYLSQKLNIPITYYEDIYDINHPDKLRKGNRVDYGNKLI